MKVETRASAGVLRVASLAVLSVIMSFQCHAESGITNVIGVTTNVSGSYTVGTSGPFNALIVTNGAALNVTFNGIIGNLVTASNNWVLITGAGSSWSNSGSLYIGSSGARSVLTITNNGAVFATNIILGLASTSTGNVLTVSGGNLYATNSLGRGALDVRRGTLNFNGGNIVTDWLYVTNNAVDPYSGRAVRNSIFNFNAGTLTTRNGSRIVMSYSSNVVIGATAGQVALWNILGGTNTITNVVKSSGESYTRGSTILGSKTDAIGIVNVTGVGTVWSNASDLRIGGTSAGNQLIVTNGARVFNDYGYIGYSTSASNNTVLVSGPGSVWSNNSDIYVGYSGSSNQLIIANGGQARTSTNSLPLGQNNHSGYVGYNAGANNNSVLVTGVGSLWSNNYGVYVGYSGSSNQLTVSNGGVVQGTYIVIGSQGGVVGNSIVLNGGYLYDGSYTLFYNSPSTAMSYLTSGYLDVRRGSLTINSGTVSVDELRVTNGASSIVNFNGGTLSIGAKYGSGRTVINNGSAFVVGDTGTGATLYLAKGTHWFNDGLIIGNSGVSNALNISGGSRVMTPNLIVGALSGASSNAVSLSSGVLLITNGLGGGVLDVRRGSLALNGGTVTVDRIFVTNAASVFNFNSGRVETTGITISNGVPFAVGSGTGAATLNLLGGSHSFANGLTIAGNSMLAGAGTLLLGGVTTTNFGTIAVGVLAQVPGGLTNVGSLIEIPGSVLEIGVGRNQGMDCGFLRVQGSATLDGRLDLALSPYYLDAGGLIAATDAFTMLTANSPLAGAFTNVASGARLDSMEQIGSFLVSYAASNVVLSGFEPAPKLGVLMITNHYTTNGLVVGNLVANNQLIVTNGGVLDSTLAVLGRTVNSSNNSALVTGSGSVWNDAGLLRVGNFGPGNQMMVAAGGQVFSAQGVLGWATGSCNNAVLVTDIGSVWSNANDLFVGYVDSANQMAVSNGGFVSSRTGYVGYASSANNNMALVSGIGSVWSNSYGVYVGYSGSGNQLTITNGGQGLGRSGSSYVGYNVGATNNIVLVSDAGSLWNNGYNNVYVGYSGSGNQLTITNSGMVYDSSGYVGYNASASNNSAMVTGAGSVWSNSGNLYVGYSGSGNQLTITNSGRAVYSYGSIGENTSASNNSVTVTGASSVWSNSSSIYVGNSGSGNQLTVTNGGRVFNSSGSIGNNVSASNNSVTVMGTGSVWSNSSTLTVGYGGAGNILMIANGGQVFNASGNIGNNASASNNSVTVTGTSSVWNNIGDLLVGPSGSSNTLMIANGGQVFNSNGYIGNNASASNNSVMVTGVGSVWSNGSTLYIGGYNNSGNNLTISNNGQVFSSGSYIGVSDYTHSSDNWVVVTGAGSVWNNSGSLFVGSTDCGNSLTITGGGQMFSSNSYIGSDHNGSNNSVLISGFGSVWSNSGSLYVGDDGLGNSMVITNGGKVFDTVGYIGNFFNANNNSVLVSGVGSVWNNSTTLYVGSYGSSNQIAINNAGAVSALNAVIGSQWGVSNVVTLNGGYLLVTNSVGVGLIDVNWGALTINSGTVTVDQLSVANGWGAVSFNGGTLNSRGTVINNGSVFTVGDTGTGASLNLSGGQHSFNNGLIVGNNGVGNAMNISGGSQVSTPNLIVGALNNAAGNTVSLSNGSLSVSGSGSLDVRRGSFTLNSGTATVIQILVTNGAASVFNFNGGRLETAGITVSNGVIFAVGNGTGSATLNLLGGSHSFANGLTVSSNSMLAGAGTLLLGGVTTTNFGTIAAGVLAQVPGGLTNNGNLVEAAGSVLELGVGRKQGLDCGFLRVQGTATLGGRLDTALSPYYLDAGGLISATDVFTVLAANTPLAGAFTNVASGTRMSSIEQLGSFVVNYSGNNVVLSNFSTSAELGALTITNHYTTNGLVAGNLVANNQLIVTNGGVLDGSLAVLGRTANSTNNTTLVTGSGSIWNDTGLLRVGNFGSGNRMTVMAGGQVFSAQGVLGWATGSCNNLVLVTGGGSVWSNSGALTVGSSGTNNQLVISNGGSVFASDLTVGTNASAWGNRVSITDGWLSVANTGSGSGMLDVRRGTLDISGGTVSVAQLSVTNTSGMVAFNGGTLNSAGTLINNGNAFVVGDTGNGSTLNLTGNRHSFGGSLIVGNSSTGNRLAITGGAWVFNGGSYDNYVGYNTNAGSNTVIVGGVGSVWSNYNDLHVGYSGFANQLIITNSGQVWNDYGYVGFDSGASNNSVTVTGVGSIWSNSSTLSVGSSGSSNSLIITNSGQVFNGDGYIGNNSASNNWVIVTGVGSVWSNSGDLSVGYHASNNNLTINSGGQVFNSDGHIGYFGGAGNNAVFVTGTGSLWGNSGSLQVGNGYDSPGSGNRLTIQSGGRVLNGDANIALYASDSNNSVWVTDPGSVWSNSSALSVGVSGSGNSLTITNGGQVFNNIGWIGFDSSASNNWVAVTGAGSVWRNSDSLYVGSSGSSNSLTITDSGQVFGSNSYIGSSSSASNNWVLVTGIGSRWSNSGSLYAGNYSSGTSLTITNGGQVFSADGYIGSYGSVGNNTVKVAGPGSLWNNTNSLIIGNYAGGSNQVIVTDGGQVSGGGWITVGSGSTTFGNSMIASNSVRLNSVGLAIGGSGARSNSVALLSNTVWNLGGGALVWGSGGGAVSNSLFIDGSSRLTNIVGLTLGDNDTTFYMTNSSGGFVLNGFTTNQLQFAPSGFGALVVGASGSHGTTLVISNYILNATQPACVGNSANSNAVLVAGGGSVWNNSSNLSIGYYGSSNSLTIANGGQVVDSATILVGYGSSGYGNSLVASNAVYLSTTGLALGVNGARNNSVTLLSNTVWNLGGGTLVWGSGSGAISNSLIIDGTSTLTNISGLVLGDNNTTFYMTNSPGGCVLNGFTTNQIGFSPAGLGGLTIGSGGSGTTLIISNYVLNTTAASFIGSNANNNAVLVSGNGSLWSGTSNLYMGFDYFSSNNSLTIANNGQVFNSGTLYVGSNGRNNRLSLMDNGSLAASNIIVGSAYYYSTGNLVTVSGGNLYVTNATANGALDICRGTLALNSGTVTVNQLFATNLANSVINFNGGTLNSGGSTINNSSVFQVGDGLSSATLHLNGGAHSFANNLFINTNAFLTGTGSITGSITDAGLISPGDSVGVITGTGGLTVLNGGTLAMDLAGTNSWLYDQFSLTSAFNFGGALTVSLQNGFRPHAGDRFDLFDFASATGAFSATNLPVLDSVLYWDTSLLYATGELLVGGPQAAWMLTPSDGAVFNSSTVTFNWAGSTGASSYALWVGSASNSYDLCALAVGTNLSQTVTLPVDGRPLYVRLWSLINAIWQYNDYSYTAAPPVLAQMLSPANGTTNSSGSVTFTWNAGGGVSQYALWVGSAAGTYDISALAVGTNLTQQLTLPANGRGLYVRLYSFINGVWQYNDYTYTAYTAPSPVRAAMVSPGSGTTNGSASVTFTWDAGVGASQYALWVGSAAGTYDISALNADTNLSCQVTGLPMDGRSLHVRLWSFINGEWQWNNYSYTAYAAPTAKAAMISPASGATNSSASVTFTWDTGVGASQYALWVGCASNSYDLCALAVGTNQSQTLTLPVDGRSLWVRLWSWINGGWQYNDYSYWAFTTVKARFTGLSNGATLSSTNVTLSWDGGAGASQYALWVGSTPGSYDLCAWATGTNQSQALTLPSDGRRLYVRLWSLINGTWKWNNYELTAYVAPASQAAQMLSPTNGVTLTNATTTFNWNSGTGATAYALWVGCVSGDYDLNALAVGTNRTHALSVPMDGGSIYVRLWSLISGTWQWNDYTYGTTAGGVAVKAQMVTPGGGTTLTNATTTFSWNSGTGVSQYALWVGSMPSSYDLEAVATGTNRSYTVTGLPVDGGPLYMRLWSLMSGTWKFNDYFYQAFFGP